jgi:DNA-binding response OmpR family regulator
MNAKILIAEDDVNIRLGLVATLESEGYSVTAAGDGVQVLRLFGQQKFDLVILDVMMPKASGYDVCRELRTRDVQIPILFLTAKGEEIDKVVGLKLGADDYVGKPFQMEELLARLSAVLKRSKNNVVKQLTFGEFVLEEETQTLIANDGKTLLLTSTEYRLLRYFVQNAGKVLSKTTLTEHVYEYDSDKDSNVIEVYVNRLRQKVGEKYIQTRRGQGYVFNIE